MLFRSRAVLHALLESGDAAQLPPPIRAALHFHLGDLDRGEGRPADAEAQFAACLALEPSHRAAREGLEALVRSRSVDDTTRVQAA